MATSKGYGSGRVFQRGSRWWIAWSEDGVEHRESAGATSREAQRALTERLSLVHRGIPTIYDGHRLRVDEILDSYVNHLENSGAKSVRPTRAHMKPLRSYLGHIRITHLAPPPIERYIRGRREEKLSDVTIAQELLILRTALNLARKQNRILVVPYIPRPRADKVRHGFVEPETMELIYPHLAAPFDDAIRFAYLTAWRSAEIRDLRWEHVYRDDAEIRLPDTKNGDPRTIPLVGQRAAIIERRWAERTLASPYVFHLDGKPLAHSLLARFQAACAAAGLPKMLVHDLRRSAARNMRRAGVPEETVMKIGGWRSASVFRRYNVVSTEDQRRAMDATDDYQRRRVSTLAVFPVGQHSDKAAE